MKKDNKKGSAVIGIDADPQNTPLTRKHDVILL